MTNEKALDALTRVGYIQSASAGQREVMPRITTCPRCGKLMRMPIYTNARSRHAECYVCDACGTDEALRDWSGSPLPPSNWNIITDVLDVLNGEDAPTSLDGPAR